MTRASDTARLLGAGGTFGGAITSNSGIVIDNITIDGTEIDLSSGNLTLDVAGQLVINSDSGQIVLQDDTVNWGNLQNSSGDFVIESLGTDKDIIFKGLDGSSTIEAMRIDMSSGGFVGIGTDSPLHQLQNEGTSYFKDNVFIAGGLSKMVSSDSSSNPLIFGINGVEKARLTSAGKFGINTTSPNEPLRVQSDSDTDFDPSNAEFNSALMLKNSTSGAGNCVSLGLSTETNGEIFLSSVQNSGTQDADFVISTRSGGSRAERMRIESDGDVLIGKDSTTINSDGTAISSTLGIRPVVSNDMCMLANRRGSDGTLIQFRQDSTAEGSISVSGTTVSYNGGHLSRWSQLTDNTRDNTIVKGTVMTNLDQMAEWTTDGVTEDNEQLNCMAISSVEGDVNVAGVFVNWDDDDDVYTNDMNVAMTGDMVIRIAKDTTVARGDLLMSAGDGTAKPQGDDIIRSKTIAKVTSTHKSHTYEDGTYLVPCVLMAC